MAIHRLFFQIVVHFRAADLTTLWNAWNDFSQDYNHNPESERQQKLRMQIVYNGLPKFLGRLLYAYLHPLLGVDELSG